MNVRRHIPAATVGAVLCAVGASSMARAPAEHPLPAALPDQIVFEHVRVLPMDSARALEDQTVIVRGSRIVSIGPSGSELPEENATRIDGRGATLVPGLADMHVHLYSEADLLNYLAHGVTTVMDLNGSARARTWRDQSRPGSVPAPTVYVSGPSLNGYPPGNPTFVALDDPELAAFEVRRQKAAGYDLVKVYSMLAPSVYRSVMETAAQVEFAVAGHIPLQVGLKESLAAGQSMIAHGEEYWKVVGRADSASVEAAIEATRGAGVFVTPNVSAIDRILAESADLPGLMADREAAFVPPAAYSEWMPSNNRYWGADTASVLPSFRAELAFIRRLTHEFSASGVPLLVGTDSPVFGFAGASAYREIALLVDAGLAPYEALTAATRAAGEFVADGIDPRERFGRIAPGYRADLLLVDGDPLSDVSALARIKGVMARGTWWTAEHLTDLRDARSELHGDLRERVARIDSLMVAGEVRQAMQLYEATRAEHPGVDLIAEVVLLTWGRALLRGERSDTVAASRVFEAAVQAYPLSPAVWSGLAEAELAAGDTAGARAAFTHAQELSPADAAVRDRLARLEAAGAVPHFEVEGVYRMTTEADVGGERRQVELILTLERDATTWKGRIDSDSPLPQLEVVEVEAGGDRLWVSAPLDGRLLSLRLIVREDEIRGAWNLGFSEQGVIRGERSPRQETLKAAPET